MLLALFSLMALLPVVRTVAHWLMPSMAAGVRASLAPSQRTFEGEATFSQDRQDASHRFALKSLKPLLGTAV